MVRIIENKENHIPLTFAKYLARTPNRRRGAASFIQTSPGNESEVETASESEHSPVLFSLRNKRSVPESSQILFLSQLNEGMNSPSSISLPSSPTPPLHSSVKRTHPLPEYKTTELKSILPPLPIFPPSPLPQENLSQKDNCTQSTNTTLELSSNSFNQLPMIPVTDSNDLGQSASKRIDNTCLAEVHSECVPVVHALISSTPKDSVHPDLEKNISNPKQPRSTKIARSRNRRAFPGNNPEDQERYYAILLGQLDGKMLSVDLIRQEFSIRDIHFILTQNAQFVPSSYNKMRLAERLFSSIQEGKIVFPPREEKMIQKKEELTIPQSISLSQLSQLSQFPHLSQLSQLSQRTALPSVTPSIETLLCSEFPSLFSLYKSHTILHNPVEWIDAPSITLSIEFPSLYKLLAEEDMVIERPPSSTNSDVLRCPNTFPPTITKLIVSALHDKLYLLNYWSKYNEDLLSFCPGDQVAVHIPSLQAQNELVKSMEPSTIDLHEKCIFPDIDRIRKCALGKDGKWLEVSILSKEFVSIVQNSFIVLYNVSICTHPSTKFQIFQFPWTISAFTPILPLSLLSHYAGMLDQSLETESSPKRVQTALAAKQWNSRVGDIVVVLLQNQFCLGEITAILHSFHIKLRLLKLHSDQSSPWIAIDDCELELFPWDVCFILLSSKS